MAAGAGAGAGEGEGGAVRGRVQGSKQEGALQVRVPVTELWQQADM